MKTKEVREGISVILAIEQVMLYKCINAANDDDDARFSHSVEKSQTESHKQQ